MTVTELPLVPPARLAVLLTAKRRESGVDLVDLSRRSEHRFSPSMLEKIERGVVPLDEAALHDLVKIYGLESAISLPKRSKLILDLDALRVGVGDTVIPFETSTTDVVLERYVSLLYLLRNEKPGRVLPLRDDDLDVLGSTLDLSVTRLTSDLSAIMGAAATNQRTSRLSRQLSLGAAGLLVGMTAVGSLIIVGAPDASTVAAEPVANSDAVSATLASASPDASVGLSAASTLQADQGDHRIATAATSRNDLVEAPTDTSKTVTRSSSSSGSTSASSSPEAVAPTDLVAELSSDDGSLGTNITMVAEPIDAVAETMPIDLAAVESYLGRDLQSLVPSWTIQIRGELSGYKGQTNRIERTITVFADEGSTVGDIAEVLAHEMGHAIDLDHLDTASRTQWVEMRGMPMVWWAGEGLNDFSVGAGDFAEGVAAYLTGSPSSSTYGDFTADQLAFVAQFVAP